MVATILMFVVILVVLVLVHEVGHFVTAKLTGVRVEEFGLGLPPRLLSIKRGETIYSLNALPLGGFVRMAGEEDPDVPRSLSSKSIPTRLLILSAGSIMNLLLPIVLLSIAAMIPHDIYIGQVVVEEVNPNSPAADAGIQPGDTFISINDKPVRNTGDVLRYFYTYLGSNFPITVRHSDGTIEEIRLTARWKPPEGEGSVGIGVRTLDPTVTSERAFFWQAIPTGAVNYWEMVVLFKNGLISMFIGAMPLELTGPVGLAQLTGEVAKGGMSPTLELAAFISINLAILNIFPIPAMDGGRIMFVLLEWVRRGKRISAKTEGLIHTIGFILLMGVFLAVTYQDIVRFISGESFF